MKITTSVLRLIEFASNNRYPVYVGLHDVTIDALADGRFHIYYGDACDVVLISRKTRYGQSHLIGEDEFRTLIYRRLHGVPDSSESQLIVSSRFTDDKEDDNYHAYL